MQGVQAVVRIQSQYAAEIATRIALQQQPTGGQDGQQADPLHRPQAQHFAQRAIGPYAMQRIVVAVDPSGTAGESDDGDSIGIVVAGKGVDGRAYVLADRTCKLSPGGWGRRAVAAYHEFGADRIVAERNFGGDMVPYTIRTVDPDVPVKVVTASRGKVMRAEPIAALYEQGKVSHLGGLESLEDQCCLIGPDGYIGEGSPDRVDAMVWALTELMLGSQDYDFKLNL